MKVEVTDLKAPNAANETVANATGVQVKLWISSDSNDPIDTGAPDVLETAETITGGVLSIPLDVGGTPAVAHSAVRGTNAASSGTTDTLTGYVHPGGGLVVFHLCNSNSTVSATFNSVSMTYLAKGVMNSSTRQMSAFFLDAAAATGDIVVTLGVTDTRHGIYAMSVGENVKVARTAVVDNLTSGTLVISTTVNTTTNDLVLFGCGWTTSATAVASYSTDQTQVVADDAPTRADISKKSGLSGSTTVTTTLDDADNAVIPVGIAVVIEPDGIATSVGNPVLGVAKWTVATDDYFFPIDTTVQEDV